MFSVVALLSWVFLEWESLAKCSIQLFREIALTVSELTLPFSNFSCAQKSFKLSVNGYTLLMLSVSHFCLQLSIVCWNWAMIQGSVSFLFKLAAKYFSYFLVEIYKYHYTRVYWVSSFFMFSFYWQHQLFKNFTKNLWHFEVSLFTRDMENFSF